MEIAHLTYNSVFKDHRGTFAPLSLKNNVGSKDKNWIQSNVSVNPLLYTLRGLHFQINDKEQAKLIKVISGSIIDFVLDIRPTSPEFLKLSLFEMSPGSELLVPRGYAHGFITTDVNTVVQYLVDNDYSPENEGSIYWKEQWLGLDKKLYELIGFDDEDIVISDKDYITKNFDVL